MVVMHYFSEKRIYVLERVMVRFASQQLLSTSVGVGDGSWSMRGSYHPILDDVSPRGFLQMVYGQFEFSPLL
jgi:hypothetical protein